MTSEDIFVDEVTAGAAFFIGTSAARRFARGFATTVAGAFATTAFGAATTAGAAGATFCCATRERAASMDARALAFDALCCAAVFPLRALPASILALFAARRASMSALDFVAILLVILCYELFGELLKVFAVICL